MHFHVHIIDAHTQPFALHAKRPASSPRSNAWNEDLGDGSGEEADELATGTKQKRALEEQEHERELSAYERQRNTNVLLNRGVLEGLGLADSALGCKATATGKKRARLGAPGQKSASESLGEEPPRPRSTRLAGRDRRRYSQDLLGSEEEEEE